MRALEATRRMSAASASPNPAPAAGPFTAAMTGFSHAGCDSTHRPTQANGSRRSTRVESGRRRRRGEIETGTESAPGAGDHDDANRVLGRGDVDGARKLVSEVGIDGVQSLRAIERYGVNAGGRSRAKQRRHVAVAVGLDSWKLAATEPRPTVSAPSSTSVALPLHHAHGHHAAVGAVQQPLHGLAALARRPSEREWNRRPLERLRAKAVGDELRFRHVRACAG